MTYDNSLRNNDNKNNEQEVVLLCVLLVAYVYYGFVWMSSDHYKVYLCSDVYIVLHSGTEQNSIAGKEGGAEDMNLRDFPGQLS